MTRSFAVEHVTIRNYSLATVSRIFLFWFISLSKQVLSTWKLEYMYLVKTHVSKRATTMHTLSRTTTFDLWNRTRVAVVRREYIVHILLIATWVFSLSWRPYYFWIFKTLLWLHILMSSVKDVLRYIRTTVVNWWCHIHRSFI